jgi:beta-glucosidase/6-phospho-beta-glucosidase/beta-galactosidase
MPFPSSFLWGVATAGYQVEGGIEDNDWAHFVGSAEIRARVHGIGAFRRYDINLSAPGDALNHKDINVFIQDLDRAVALGATAYRMSLEWSRFQLRPPDAAAPRALEMAAVEFYAQRIEAVLARGLVLHLTLNHLTLPAWVLTPSIASTTAGAYVFGPQVAVEDEAFREHPGWEGERTPQLFANYAAAVVEAYHSRFAGRGEIFWATFNEPVGSMVGAGYFAGIWPPGFSLDGGRGRTAYFHILRAHILAYDLIKEVSDGAARVGIVHSVLHTRLTGEAPTESTRYAAGVAGVVGGLFGFATGFAVCSWPCALLGAIIGVFVGLSLASSAGITIGRAVPPGGINEVARRFFEYFYHEHILNALILGQVDLELSLGNAGRRVVGIPEFIAGSQTLTHGVPVPNIPNTSRVDFLGINYYRTVFIYEDFLFASRVPYAGGVFTDDLRMTEEARILVNDLGWGMYPEGLGEIVTRIHLRYSQPSQPLPIIISENGCPESADKLRAPYTVAHLEALDRALQQNDPVLGPPRVLGYIHWTLADNYEWQHGYEENSRFGLFTVDRQPPNDRRITEGALAFHVLARSRDPAVAREKFGSIDPTLPQIVKPSASPGRQWRGGLGSEPARLWLTSIAPDSIQGLMYYPDRKQWVRVDDVNYDPATRAIRLSHLRVGGTPARTFEATVTDTALDNGTCTDFLGFGSTARHLWHAPLDPLVGFWVPTPADLAAPRRGGDREGWSMLSLECWDDFWRAKILWERCSWESIRQMHLVSEDGIATLTWLTSYGGFIVSLVTEPGGQLLRGVCAASATPGDTFLFEASRLPDGLPF